MIDNSKSTLVGVTLRNDLDQNFLLNVNGVAQNSKFLIDMLHLLGMEAFFIVSNPVPENRLKISQDTYDAYTLDDISNAVICPRIVFEPSFVITQSLRDLWREKFSIQFVSINYGNVMLMDIEEIFLRRNTSGKIYFSDTDQVWISPHHEHGLSYLETIYQAPVNIAPYIWEPDFIDKPFNAWEYNKPKDIFVMEPNFNVVKTALIPMTIIERLHQSSPNSFGQATILNGLDWRENDYFVDNMLTNMRSLQAQTNKVYFSGRASFDEVFKKPDVMLSHQWMNELNYTYCEALYKGIPLVHNSPAISEVGYYYPDFDVKAGAEQLQLALRSLPLEAELTRSRHFLNRYSIHNKDNQTTYRSLLKKLGIGL